MLSGLRADPDPLDEGSIAAEPRRIPVLLILAIILALAWITGFTVFHVAGAAIHILIVVAVISLVLHLVRGRKGS
jgi:hypothetical protein